MTQYKVPPADYNLSEAVAETLRTLYLEERKSMVDAAAVAKFRTGEDFAESSAIQFIRDNGWKRSYSTKGSVWRKYEDAHFRKLSAERSRRG